MQSSGFLVAWNVPLEDLNPADNWTYENYHEPPRCTCDKSGDRSQHLEAKISYFLRINKFHTKSSKNTQLSWKFPPKEEFFHPIRRSDGRKTQLGLALEEKKFTCSKVLKYLNFKRILYSRAR